MLGEIEDRLAIALAQVEIAARGDDLVLQRHRLCDDLARRRDDGALADHVRALLDTAFGGADHPGGVLIGACLHGQMVVELGQAVDVAMAGVIVGRVVAEHDHLDALQPHDAIGLGPAPVVADAHAHDAAEAAPDAEAQIAWLEIALLQMLMSAVRLRLGMAGQMDLAVFADDVAVAVDEDRCVEAALAAVFIDKLGVAEIETDAELLRFVEQRLRFRARHFLLVIAVELGLVLDQPAREEGGERELGEHDELGAPALRLAHQGDQAPTVSLRVSDFAIGPICADAAWTILAMLLPPQPSCFSLLKLSLPARSRHG